MEEQGCCSACPILEPSTQLVPVTWHPDSPGERLCCGCFNRLFPEETMVSFDLTILPKWTAEHFAPAHVMMLGARKKLLVLVSQLDAHHVTLFRSFAKEAGLEEEPDPELLRQVARDYRETKDAVAKMGTRSWWDQMAIWRSFALGPNTK